MNLNTLTMVAVVFLAASPEFSVAGLCFESPQAHSEAPEVVLTVAPIVPSWTASVAAKGDIVIDLKIGISGDVESAVVVDGHPMLRETTRTACLQWRFTAAAGPIRTVRLTFIYSTLLGKFPPRVLVQPYGMELAVDFAPFPDTASYIPQDFVAGKSRCEVHNTPLQRDKVKIGYGLIGYKVGYLKAQETLFPHSESYVGGGCVIYDYSPKYAEVLYCPACREAEARWLKAHRKKTLQF